jgi:mannose-6-phosphate isomerase-like protein (cupin superfamily)
MPHRISNVVFALALLPLASYANQELSVKPLAEKKVSELPAGPLYWRIENVDTKSHADSMAGPYSLVVESDGRVWLFTLGARETPVSTGAVKVADVGPVPRIDAAHYLLRINDASGPSGSATSVHSHPGSEAYFVLRGEQTIRAADRTMHVHTGQGEAGQGAERPMQVSSSGSSDLHALVMFVVDADKPFSSPATLP